MTAEKTLETLNLLLQYCTQNKGVFTTGERILINQLRGKILALNDPNLKLIKLDSSSDELNKKIQLNLNHISKIQFEPNNKILYDWNIDF